MEKKDLKRILNETKVIINEDNNTYDCDFGEEFNNHDWYTVDEAEMIIENALSKTENNKKGKNII